MAVRLGCCLINSLTAGCAAERRDAAFLIGRIPAASSMVIDLFETLARITFALAFSPPQTEPEGARDGPCIPFPPLILDHEKACATPGIPQTARTAETTQKWRGERTVVFSINTSGLTMTGSSFINIQSNMGCKSCQQAFEDLYKRR